MRYQKQNRYNQSGFTLVEMLVVIVIMAALSGLFIVNFASLRGPRNLRIAQNEMISNIRKVQSYILSSRDVNSANEALYYMVYLTQDLSSYKVQAVGVNKTTKATSFFDNVEVINLPSGITITSMELRDGAGVLQTWVGNPSVVTPQNKIHQTSKCIQVVFASPYAKTYLEGNNGPTLCNFYAISTDPQLVDSRADLNLEITLRDKASGTTRKVSVRGVTGLVQPK